ncbi:MAG: TonB-dependent receptor [Alphaproteobacteria bacterium]
MTLSGPAFAQDGQSNEVVVTASRAGNSAYTASTPTSVVTADTLEKRGLTNFSQLVLQNPAFKADTSPNGNGVKAATTGQTSANLRNLGSARTLVLVNGARVVPLAAAVSTGTPVTTDLNSIPSILINRVEVVTGGASAQWGSDAISGVVNILLNNTYEGLKVTGQYGISDQSDDATKSAGVLAGTAFGPDKRGHFVIAGEWLSSDGLGDYRTRDYASELRGYNSTTAAYRAANPGAPSLLRTNNYVSAYATGGNIPATAPVGLRNIEFLPNGQTTTWDPGAFQAGQVQLGGGQGLGSWIDINLVPEYSRYSTYARAEYELTNKITANLEIGYAGLNGGQNGATPRTVLGSTTYVDPTTGLVTATKPIQIDNAYLPASVKAAMATAGVTSFQLARMNSDIGPTLRGQKPKIQASTPHAAIGFKGEFTDKWKWDAHYTWGENQYHMILENNFVNARYNFAADAVVNPLNGQIVCRATLPGPMFNAAAAGCVPANLFGDGSVSAAAKAYITTTSWQKSLYTQQTAAYNVQGELFDLPAGPVSIGTGVEWRRESQAADVDPLGNNNQYGFGNGSDFRGKFSTKEVYVDTVFPLLKDQPFAKSLDFTAAGRISDYSNFGTARTWKLGASWEPIDSVKFRVTESADFRAPAIYELFDGGTTTFNAITLRGQTYIIPQNATKGNPNLGPEHSKTLTIGGSYQPEFIPGLRLSLDYFKIKINDATIALAAASVANQCSAGSAYYCSFFTFDASGAPTSLLVGAQNLAKLESSGVDFQANYTKDLSGFAGLPENTRLDMGAQGTWTDHFISNPGISPAIDLVGQNDDAGTPYWRAQFQQSLTFNKLRVTTEENYVSSGKLNNTFNTAPTLTINDNHVPSYFTVNLFANYELTQKVRAFVGVDNLLDRDPPSIPFAYPAPDFAGAMYDKVGRFYRVGLTYEF